MSVPSPCVSICKMSPEMAKRAGCTTLVGSGGICVGCFRSMDEIMMWGTASDAEKRAVWSALKDRAQQAGVQLSANP